VTVNPNANLADTAAVNVSASGFTPNFTASVYQCADVGQVMTCSADPIRQVPLSGSGTFSNVTTEVKAVFFGEQGANVECRTNCRILVEDPVGRSGQASISFSRFASSK